MHTATTYHMKHTLIISWYDIKFSQKYPWWRQLGGCLSFHLQSIIFCNFEWIPSALLQPKMSSMCLRVYLVVLESHASVVEDTNDEDFSISDSIFSPDHMDQQTLQKQSQTCPSISELPQHNKWSHLEEKNKYHICNIK